MSDTAQFWLFLAVWLLFTAAMVWLVVRTVPDTVQAPDDTEDTSVPLFLI